MNDPESLEIPVLLGTVRTARRSEHVARWVLGELLARPDVSTKLIDLDDFHLPVMEERLSEHASPPPGATDLAARLARADGLLIVTPEYKGAYPGSLKNAFDYLDAGVFRRMPIGIVTVSAGGFGGVNCLAQLRLVCLAMGGSPLPMTFAVSNIQKAFDEQGRLLEPTLPTKLAPFLDELIWHTRAFALGKRAAAGPHQNKQ
jgi:NAD(P)H-dependent FMN reductase